MLHLLFFVVGIICLAIAIYISVAFLSSPKRWPFKNYNKKTDAPSNAMRDPTPTSDSSDKTPSAAVVIFVIIFIGIFVFSMYWGIKMTMMRYSIASQAIKKGNTGAAAMALSPEIGYGIGSAAQGIGAAIR